MEHIHKDQPIQNSGAPISECGGVIIMMHGRNANAADILSLSAYFSRKDIHYIAPQAADFSWYPYGFMEDREKNEPGLSSGQQVIKDLVVDLIEQGIHAHQIYLLGFSQGACLTLEFAARNPARYAGVFGLSGGLIGNKLSAKDYKGDFDKTPVFLGCSDKDPHIPLHRVKETGAVLKEMNTNLVERIYPNMPHTVIQDEIEEINKILAGSSTR